MSISGPLAIMETANLADLLTVPAGFPFTILAGPPTGVATVVGLLLIGFGLIYPMIALVRMSQQMGKDQVSQGQLVATLVVTGLLPLTTVLAGFWLLSSRARGSPVFLGALIASAVLLLLALIVRQRS